jgi:hypothetical protein
MDPDQAANELTEEQVLNFLVNTLNEEIDIDFCSERFLDSELVSIVVFGLANGTSAAAPVSSLVVSLTVGCDGELGRDHPDLSHAPGLFGFPLGPQRGRHNVCSTHPMTTQDSSLGTCPSCSATIPAGLVLIEYERADGAAAFAECPDCHEVIRPR